VTRGVSSSLVADIVRILESLVWDYPAPLDDPLWRLQRIADWFPGFGRDRETVAALYAHRGELRIPPETRALIELYEEAWREREAERVAR
jgi:hypothetical protein